MNSSEDDACVEFTSLAEAYSEPCQTFNPISTGLFRGSSELGRVSENPLNRLPYGHETWHTYIGNTYREQNGEMIFSIMVDIFC